MPTLLYAAPTGGPGALEEVIVTAQKRAQNVQDVPISIAVMTSDDIENTVANTLSDLNFALPGVEVDSNSLGGMTIRGVSGFSRNVGSEGRAGVYTDEVYVGRSAGVDQNLFDIERVEVLKGPQGTLFGRNTVSGAVNITTRKPQNHIEGSLALEAGNYDRLNGTAILNLPLVQDVLSTRLSLNGIKQHGYVDNLTTGERMGGFEKFNGRFQLRYLATDELEINFNVDARKSRKDVVGFQTFLDTDQFGIRKSTHDAQNSDDSDLLGAAMTVDYALPGEFHLKSITSYREESYESLNDEDGSALDIATSQFQEDNDQFTQELRLETPDLGGFDMILGLYYLGQKLSSDKKSNGGAYFPIPGVEIPAPGKVELQSYAAYLHSNIYLADRLTLTAGIRYTDEKKSADYSITDPTGFLFTTGTYDDKRSWDDWSPKIGLQYDLSEDAMVYGSVSRAFKAGGYNLDFVSSLEQIAYDPETAINYEFGFKSDLMDHRLRLDAAVFLMQFDDYQVFQFRQLPSGGTILVLTNTSQVTSKGAEVGLTARLLAGLTLTANYAHIDAEYDSFPDAGGIGIDYDGQAISASPKDSAYISMDYQHSLAAGLLNVHLDYAYDAAPAVHALARNRSPSYLRGRSGRPPVSASVPARDCGRR